MYIYKYIDMDIYKYLICCLGADDGAELYDFVGTYTLNMLSKKYNRNNFAPYRDDGFTVLKNKSGTQP